MSKDVKFKYGSKENLDKLPIEAGSLVVAVKQSENNAELYYDYNNEVRLPISNEID